MEKVLFHQPVIKKDISNKEIHTEAFIAINHSSREVRITEVEKGCSCTNVEYPEVIQPKEEFFIKLIVDKTGQTGYFATSATIKFSTGQEQKLILNGKLI